MIFVANFELSTLENEGNAPIDADSYYFANFKLLYLKTGLKIRTTRLNVLYILFCDLSNGIDYFCEK